MRETHKHNVDSYIPGDYYLVCDVCGLDYRKSDTRERWDHAIVCTECWEPRHPQEGVRGISEKIAVPVARPEDTSNTIESGLVAQWLDDNSIVWQDDNQQWIDDYTDNTVSQDDL